MNVLIIVVLLVAAGVVALLVPRDSESTPDWPIAASTWRPRTYTPAPAPVCWVAAMTARHAHSTYG